MTYFRPSFLRELVQLVKVAELEFHGQVKVSQSDGLDVNTFTVEIIPERGLYAHASFLFLITVTDHYPNTAPLVTCLTPVFHPNIEMSMTRDNVCLNIFRFWERHFGIKDLIHALLFLLYEPNFDDPYNMYCTNLPMPVEQCIQHTLAGGTINSVKFPPNEAWCQWAAENGMLPLKNETVQPTIEAPSNKDLRDDGVSRVDHSTECMQPLTSPHFHYALSGQFTPALPETSDTDWTNQSPLIGRLLPFGFLCHITVETMNNFVVPDLPWSNYNRFYYAESCNTDSAEFLWNSVDASVGLNHAEHTEPFCALKPQRSTINSWTSPIYEATQALLNSEISDMEELEQMLATLLLDAQNDHTNESQQADGGTWDRVESGCLGGENSVLSPDASERNDTDSNTDSHVQAKDVEDATSEQCLVGPTFYSSGESEASVLEPQMSASHCETTADLDEPPQDITKVLIIHGNERTDLIASGETQQKPSTHSIDAHTTPTSSSPAKIADPVGTNAVHLGCLDSQVNDKSLSTPLPGSGTRVDNQDGTEETVEHSTRPSRRIELSSEEYSMLPLEIQALLEEPMLDLSLMYPTVERFGSSTWHVLPHQFAVFKRFLCTLQPCTWPFYQTRWPPFWAPGRGATLTPADFCSCSEDDIRASSAQLRCDLFRYCRRYQRHHPSDTQCSLLIVDPLALSPCSPVLNYMVCTFPLRVNPSVICLRSTRWISLSESLLFSLQFDTKSTPCSFWLLLLTSSCVLCNFVCYFSRLELYGTSLGFSRRTRYTVIDYLASVCLVPATLGCGQSALFDGWPLWVASRAARFICSLVWSLIPCGHSRGSVQSGSRPRLWFPFSDIDEI